MSKKILLSAKSILPIASKEIVDGAIVIDQGKISDLGKRSILEKKHPRITKKHFPHSVILPGFVNVHSHAVYTQSLTNGKETHYSEWLSGMIQAVKENRSTKTKRKKSCRANLKEMLASGITTIADSGPYEEVLEEVSALGIRTIFFKEVFGFAESKQDDLAKEIMKSIQALQRKFSKKIRIGISLHSPYATPVKLLKEVNQFCKTKKIPFMLHVAESPEEHQFFAKGKGPFNHIFPDREKEIPRAISSVQYLKTQKVLGSHLLAVHCVQVDQKDMGDLARSKTRIAFCPASNFALKVGVAPVREFLKQKQVVGLGTDGKSSVPELSFFSAMRDAASFGELSPKEVLKMATLEGAKALGLDKEVGSLKRGKKADLMALSVSSFRHAPYSDIEQKVVWGSVPQDIEMVMIEGKVALGKL